MKDGYKISERIIERVPGPDMVELTLRLVGKEISSILVDREGTVYQLHYPSTKAYGGPETAEAISELMQIAARIASGGTL